MHGQVAVQVARYSRRVIRTHDLQYRYPKSEAALRFPDLDLPQGGVCLLRGRSGSGKSTWLSLVSGMRRPAGGMLTVAGQDLATLGPAALDAWRGHEVGLLPQRLHLSPALTVAQNLALAYYACGEPADAGAIRNALEALGVASLASRRPDALSGGQAQRVALARAVLRGPRLLLADEPTASLDDESAHAALELLVSTAASHGASLVVATHDARAVAALREFQPGAVELNLAGGGA